MEFSSVLKNHAFGDRGNGIVVIPSDWMQGRSAFGGLQAALLLGAMRRLIGGAPPLRVLQVNFIAPAPGGVPLDCVAQILRRGRNVIHIEGRLSSEQGTVCLAIGVFGVSRCSSVIMRPVQRPVIQNGSPGEMNVANATTAEFLQHFSLRWLEGALPFTGAERAESVIMLSHRDPASTTEAHVVALADAAPLVALSLLNESAARSSLTWTLEFLGVPIDGLPRDGWRMDSALVAASDGYTQQSALLWSPDGRAVALSRQTGVVFA